MTLLHRKGRWLFYAFFALGLMTASPVTAQLSGSYTIDPSSAATSTNYHSFSAVVSDLVSGTRTDTGTATGPGVSGAVTIKIADGAYREKISISAIAGASSTNTITFQSASGDSSRVILWDSSSSSATNNYTLQLAGAKYVTFKQITIKRVGDLANSVVVAMNNRANHNQFIGNLVIGRYMISTTTSGINAGQATFLLNGNDSNNLFQGNCIKYGYNGIYMTANTTNRGYNNVIKDNIFDTCAMSGIYALYQQEYLVTGNTFNMGKITVSGSSHYLSYGVRLESSVNFYITKNRFYSTSDASVSRCITVFFGDNTPGVRNLIANNFAWVSSGSTSSTGITLGGNDSLDIFYNNVLMTSAPSASAALYIYPQYAGSDNIVKNNNLVNMGTGLAIDNSNASTAYSTGVVSDYNNLYTKGTYLGNYKGTTYTSLSGWHATGFDSNSISTDPGYVSNYDLHVSNIAINNMGTPVSVTDDIDGDTRNSSTPDIGADEFTPAALDAGVTSLDSPSVYCAGTHKIVVRFTNFGTDTIKNIAINWSLNGSVQTTYNWSGTVDPAGVSTQITLGSVMLSHNTPYNLKVWVTAPNSGSDQKATNDTLRETINSGLSGSYTIGGSSPDFEKFNDALDAITLRGLCGPTTFNVRDGSYNEQLSIGKYPQSSATNTITFQSENGDSNKVILTYGSANANGVNNMTLQFNGASHVAFRDMTIERTGTGIYESVIEIKGTADNIVLENNILKGIPRATANVNSDVIVASTVDGLTIRNNYIKYGNMAINLNPSSTARGSSILIEDNIIDSSFNTAINVAFSDVVTIHGNELMNIAAGGSTFSGISLNSSDSAIRVTANNVQMMNGGLSGILLLSNNGSVSPALIANNFVYLNAGTTVPKGILDSLSTYQNIYHNTVRIASTNSGYAFYGNASGNVNLVNNILYNSGGGYAIGVNNTSTLATSDRNNLYTSGSNLGRYGSTNASDLKAWQTASSKDANSVSLDPGFVSTGYVVTNKKLWGKGTPITGVTTDIEGATRNSIRPTIGAYELFIPANDAGVTLIASPVSPICEGTSNDIKINVYNYGSDTLKSVTIKWSVNGTAQTDVTLNLNLDFDKSTVVTLGNRNFSAGTVNIVASTFSPNGQTDADNSNDTAKAIITVSALPVANAGLDKKICELSSTTIGVPPVPTMAYSWTSNPAGFTSKDAAPAVSPKVTTTYYLEVINSANCIGKDTVIVTVDPAPVANAGRDSAICAGSALQIGSGAVLGNTYSWSSNPTGFTSTTANPTVTPTVNTWYILEVTHTSTGCKSKDSAQVSINPLPVPGVITSTNICLGENITIGASTVPGLNYSWTSKPAGFTSTDANPSVSPSTDTWYYLTVTDKSGCSGIDSLEIKINPVPTANAGSNQSICAGQSVQIGSVAIPGITYAWESTPSGFTSTSANPTVSPNVTTTYSVIVTNTDGCQDTAEVTVTVNPLPDAEVGTSRSICLGESVALGSTEITGNTYSWISDPAGFTSTDADPTVTPAITTSYILTETITATGCTNTDTVVITVDPLPVADAGLDKDICLDNGTTIGTAAITGQSYSWVSIPAGFTSTDAMPSVNPIVTTTYVVTATMDATNCTSTDTVVVRILPLPDAGSLTGPDQVCAGSMGVYKPSAIVTGDTYTFVQGATTGGTGTTITTTPDSAIINWGESGSVTLWLIAANTDGCEDSVSLTVTINDKPVASFISDTVCSGNATQFTNTSTGAVSTHWVFGDGNTSSDENPSHVYAAAGTYDVTLVALNASGCYDSTTSTIAVNALPAATFTAANACLGTPIVFDNTSSASAISFAWSFGDGNISTDESPTHTYAAAGSYSVKLVAITVNGCIDSIEQTVTVDSLPQTAGFTIQQGTSRNYTFTANDNSQAQYAWEFGDGGTGTGAVANHSYASEGTYNVKLIVTNSEGCTLTKDTSLVVITNGIKELSVNELKLEIYPNPFSNATALKYTLVKRSNVNIVLMDMTGKQIAGLVNNADMTPGQYTYELNASEFDLKSGVYFVNFLINGESAVRRIVRVE